MKINEIKVKEIITKSGLPDSDYVINPYIGCMHSCIYCYADFMKRFTNHKEDWGDFIDVKINGPEIIPENTNKYKGKSITLSSVTDPYHPIEQRYQVTRKILQKLIQLKPNLCILTKSDLILRDIDLIKQFDNCIVGVSLSQTDEKVRKLLEPLASSVERRINTLKELHNNGIKTALFISPIFPEISNWKELIIKTKDFVNEIWFENLNIRPNNKNKIYEFLNKTNPNLVSAYDNIYSKDSNYWVNMSNEITDFCQKANINCKVYFGHGK